MNMSRELYIELVCLLQEETDDSITGKMNVLIANYTKKDLQEALLVRDHNGCLPIHWACRLKAPLEVIQLLLESDAEKKTIYYASRRDGPVDVVQFLLKVSIRDRIEQLCLPQWRVDVEELINAMTEEDSKRKKVRKIYARLLKYEEMERTISLLALAIWRTSCLKWGDMQFQSMQDMDNFRPTDEIFDPALYKRERRIKSGADVIIRGVLPFLAVDEDSESSSYDDGGRRVKPLIQQSTRENVESKVELTSLSVNLFLLMTTLSMMVLLSEALIFHLS
jgi:hypothetical protein